MKKTLFLVTSAINSSINNNEQEAIRVQETLSTFNSINAHYNNCEIWLLESGRSKINPEYYKFFPNNVRVLNFWYDKEIQNINNGLSNYVLGLKSNYNFDDKTIKQLEACYIKSLTESYVIKTIINKFSFDKFDYVIKISGRYCLSPNYKKENFQNCGKYTFSKIIPSNQGLCPVDYQYLTYLWGFCPSLQDDVKKTTSQVHEQIKQAFKSGKIMDLEHSMFDNTKDQLANIHNTRFLGVYARMGTEKYIFMQ